MTNDPLKFLGDMKLAAEFVVSTLANRQREEFEQDLILRFAIERELITVGEALNQLHRVAPEIAQQVDRWEDIIGFRNILVHGYDILNTDLIWDIAKKDIPGLLAKIQFLLEADG